MNSKSLPATSLEHGPRQGNKFALIHVDAPSPGDRVEDGETLSGRGWIVADSDVEQVAIYLDDAFVTFAYYGLPRPEIAERFPHYPQSEQSGFFFLFPVSHKASDVSTERKLVIRVTLAGGAVRDKSVVLAGTTHREVVAENLVAPVSGQAPPIRIVADLAVLDAQGILRTRGWVASLGPLLSVRMFIGNRELGEPELGKPRPDVATYYPYYPNANSSGFELNQDVRELLTSHNVLRIVATTHGNIQRQISMPLSLAAEEPAREVTAGLEVHCDKFVAGSDGRVSVEGWAFGPEVVQRIGIALDGEAIGDAVVGLSRPDVGNRFPQFPSARDSGFTFDLRLGRQLQGEHLLTVSVHSRDRSIKQVSVPLRVVENTLKDIELPNLPIERPREAIRLEIDQPRLKADHAVGILTSTLVVSGWAVSKEGVEAVYVQVDELVPLRAHIGTRREDVAAAFPDFPSALFSGFAITIPHRAFGDGSHNVRVLVHGKSGDFVQRSFGIVSERSEDAEIGQIKRHLRKSAADLNISVLNSLAHKPTFEIIIRAASLREDDLRQLSTTLESISAQLYSPWRTTVLIPDQSDDATAVLKILEAKHLTANLRIRYADESSIGLDEEPVPSHLVALSAGDQIGVDALLELAVHSGLNKYDFCYSDERTFDISTGDKRPRLKPRWSPDLLSSTNYIGRIWCVTRALAERANLTLEGLYECEYDAVLRLSELAQSIGHVPIVLCERGEKSLDKPESERLALQDAATRAGWNATVGAGLALGTWRVKRLSSKTKRVSIIIPTCGTRDLIRTCIRTIRDSTNYADIEIVCIDNIPLDNSAAKAWLAQEADLLIETDEAFNWARYNNLGAQIATGDYFLFLNDDIEIIEPDWLEALVGYADRPGVGVVGPQLLYPDRKVQHAGIFLSGSAGRHAFRFAAHDDPGPFGLALVDRNVSAVTGACMLVTRSTYEELGGFDEAHAVINNDVDFCLRVWRHGLRVVYTPHASLIHHELASRAFLPDDYDRSSFESTWSAYLANGDPFFHPGLMGDSDFYLPDPEPVQVMYPGPIMATDDVRRIIAIKLDHIGDFVTAFPAFRLLKERFRNARLTVLAPKASLSVAALEPAIDECIEFNFFSPRSEQGLRLIDESELHDLAATLLPHNFDLAIDLRMQTETRHILRIAGAKLCAGFNRNGLFPWLDVAVEWDGDPVLAPKQAHVSQRLMELVMAASAACDPLPPAIKPAYSKSSLTFLELSAVRAAPKTFFDKPLVCIHPGVGNRMRQWPASSFAALINLLIERDEVNVVIIGGPDEESIAAEVVAALNPGAVLSLVGQSALAELPTIIGACQLFIGNNSGPKHLAAALGVPTVGIHSANVDVSEWAPLGPRAVAVSRNVDCGPCYLDKPEACHRNLACLTGIRPEHVYDICRAMLQLGRAMAAGADIRAESRSGSAV